MDQTLPSLFSAKSLCLPFYIFFLTERTPFCFYIFVNRANKRLPQQLKVPGGRSVGPRQWIVAMDRRQLDIWGHRYNAMPYTGKQRRNCMGKQVSTDGSRSHITRQIHLRKSTGLIKWYGLKFNGKCIEQLTNSFGPGRHW